MLFFFEGTHLHNQYMYIDFDDTLNVDVPKFYSAAPRIPLDGLAVRVMVYKFLLKLSIKFCLRLHSSHICSD